MISELHNKDLFYKENYVFIEHFCKRIRNENELIREIQLSRLILKFYQKVYDKEQKVINREIFDDDFFNYGYIENYGYYTITDANNGYYAVINYGEDINKAFINIVQSIIDKRAKQEEKNNHREIKKKYKNRGNRRNYLEIFFMNYALSQWNKYYEGNVPNEIIDGYAKRINKAENNSMGTIISEKFKTKALKK